jgi:predicted DCC family thiol-disulfide oxidoreductase YuxK
MLTRPDFSYRSDPQVPTFDDRFPIALMDAECALCCFGARMIDRLDRSGEIRICPVQTALGRAMLSHYGVRVDCPDTWLLLERGRVLGGFEAIIRVGERSGGWGRGMSLLRILPRSLRMRIYGWIARSRYRWFGRGDLCALPAASLRARLMRDPT